MYHTFAVSWDLPHQNMADGFWRTWSANYRSFAPRLFYRSFCRQNRRTQNDLISEHRRDAHLAKDPIDGFHSDVINSEKSK